MNSELRELYQEVILDHNKNPRNKHALADATHSCDGTNPLCGDHVHVEIVVNDDMVRGVAFTGHGCAISTASASIMTEAVKGKRVGQASAMCESLVNSLTSDAPGQLEGLHPELAALEGVREFPMRVKCATLPWHTLNSALKGAGAVTTE